MLEELKSAIIEGDEDLATELIKTLLDNGEKPGNILNKGLLKGMDVVGQRFKTYEMYLPEVIMSATAMKAAIDLLKPHISKADIVTMGKIL